MSDRPIFLAAVYSLWKREILRFVRDRNRLLGSILQPLLLWVLVGSGFRGSFSPGADTGATYLEYIYPGTMMLILLFMLLFHTTVFIHMDAIIYHGTHPYTCILRRDWPHDMVY